MRLGHRRRRCEDADRTVADDVARYRGRVWLALAFLPQEEGKGVVDQRCGFSHCEVPEILSIPRQGAERRRYPSTAILQ
jgi:hypothetical protein